jgi:magnesium chelatase family protein
MITKYAAKISGPLLDRIDIHIDVPRIEYEKLSADRRGELSAQVRERVQAARNHQSARLAGTSLLSNADMGAREIPQFCKLDAEGEKLMRAAMQQLQLSARAYHRVLKLARTVADLEGCEAIHAHHLAEALQYRAKQ